MMGEEWTAKRGEEAGGCLLGRRNHPNFCLCWEGGTVALGENYISARWLRDSPVQI